MKEKKSFLERMEDFFAGKGFYIVLFVCAAIIGVSAWAIFGSSAPAFLPEETADPAWSAAASTAPTPKVTATPPSATAQGSIPSAAPVRVTDPPTPQQTEAPEETAPQPEETIPPRRAFTWPVSGEIEVPFSVENLIYNKTMADWRVHNGIDIAAPIGTKVLSASAGTVLKVYDDNMYGTTVIIDHGDGLHSIYANLAGTPAVSEGDEVLTGDVIGAVGNTALCETGEVSHLHFAMEDNGDMTDPQNYLPKR